MISLCSGGMPRGVWWRSVQGSVLLSVFINDVEVGVGGEVVMVASDTELLRKAGSSKLQKDLRILSDKMTAEIQWT